jgi:2'-5' RNA ligase
MTYITTYTDDTSHWKAWYDAYRFGIVLIYPPEPLRSLVNALREAYDPKSRAICDAHISLTVPLPRGLTESDCEALESITATHQAFSIRYGPLRHYLPAPGVCLRIEPEDTLDRLRRSLEAASCFTGAMPRPYPFSPHMTIAEYVTADETEALMAELRESAPEGEFRCSSVSLAVPDVRFHFDERRRFALAQ